MSSINHTELMVDRIIDNLKACGFDEDCMDDAIHSEIENYVSTNSIEENKDIIIGFYKDIYDAMINYKDTYGDIDFKDKAQFYACLAYQSLYDDVMDKHYDNIKEELEEFEEFND